LGKLTGGLAHEIKNPLSTIKVNLKLITEYATLADAGSARWLRKIAVVQKETDRLPIHLEPAETQIKLVGGRSRLFACNIDLLDGNYNLVV
jgi:nitrogen-specific signal transduction histidine kinase